MAKSDEMAEVIYFLSEELAVLRPDNDFMLMNKLRNVPNLLYIVYERFCEDINVVPKDQGKFSVYLGKIDVHS